MCRARHAARQHRAPVPCSYSRVIHSLYTGVAALPLVFVSAGWLPSLLLLAVLSLASGAASQLLCDAIRALPGNADYGRRVELLSATQELLPYWAYCAAFVTFIARRASVLSVGFVPTR